MKDTSLPTCHKASPTCAKRLHKHIVWLGGSAEEIHPDREMFKANNDNADEVRSESASHATVIIPPDNIHEYSLEHMTFNITLSVFCLLWQKGIIIINEYDA